MDVERVEQWLASGLLLHPLHGCNSVDLSRGVLLLAGVSSDTVCERWGQERLAQAQELAKEIGGGTHLALIILDGLGVNSLEKHLARESFLRSRKVRDVRSVFPATTSAAITALTTGDFPAQHGLLGWTTTCEGRIINPLPYVEEVSGTSLSDLGLDAGQVFEGIESSFDLVTSASRRSFSRYTGSPFTAATQAMEQRHCETMADTMEALGDFWQDCHSAGKSSFSYVYLPEPDHTEHGVGFDHEEVGNVLRDIDAELVRLWESTSSVPGKKVVITADHGHLTVMPTDQLVLGGHPEDEALLDCLLHPPTVEPRSPCFHCRPGMQDKFAALFRASRFAADFALLSTDEIERLELLGPGKLSRVARNRAGDFQALTVGPKVIVSRQSSMVGWHGGATSKEIMVPLIVAD